MSDVSRCCALRSGCGLSHPASSLGIPTATSLPGCYLYHNSSTYILAARLFNSSQCMYTSYYKHWCRNSYRHLHHYITRKFWSKEQHHAQHSALPNHFHYSQCSKLCSKTMNNWQRINWCLYIPLTDSYSQQFSCANASHAFLLHFMVHRNDMHIIELLYTCTMYCTAAQSYVHTHEAITC